MCILVTGGAGFIGSNFIIEWLDRMDDSVINLDVLTYASNLNNLDSLKNDNRYIFIQGDISNKALVKTLLHNHMPRAVINFAAESHVDRSITEPQQFMETNIIGTFHLLETVLAYWKELEGLKKTAFRFLHVSTDEVYGSLNPEDLPFSETNQHMPNSPYSASKASSDHLVRAYHQTYGLPVLTTHCSNNYGPRQFPEKIIPLIIHNALTHKPLPIYGDGLYIRDWLYVNDHCSAIRTVLAKSPVGEVYNIGGLNEKTNIELVHTLCDILDQLHPVTTCAKITSYRELITHVEDRLGHDRRYAINASKIQTELNWFPTETFETGIQKTVAWYLNNPSYIKQIIDRQRHHTFEWHQG